MATLAGRDTTGTLQPTEGEVELVGRRTRTAKVFHRVGTRQYRIGANLGPVHYRLDPWDEQEALKEIDLTMVPTPGAGWDFACETNGYQVRLWNSRTVGETTFRCVAQFRRAGRWLAMAPVALAWENEAGKRQVIAKPNPAVPPTIDNDTDTATWADAFGVGLDFAYNLRPDRFFKTLIVRTAAALPRPTINTTGLRLVLVMALAWDAAPANGFAAERPPVEVSDDLTGIDSPDEVTQDVDFSFRDAGRDVWWLRRPMAWDSADEEPQEEPHQVPVDWSLRRVGGRVFATLAVQAAALTKATFPVFIDTDIGEEQIGASADDAMSHGATYPGADRFSSTYTSENNGANTGSFYNDGLRFQGIPIPQGATIDSAAISLYATGARFLDIYIACEDVDDGAAWGVGHWPKDAYASHTGAQVRWTPAAWVDWAWRDSPDLSAPVEEVVARPGWSSGNDLNFISYNVLTYLSTAMFRTYRAYDYSGNVLGAKFNCSYTEAASFDGLLLGGD